MIRLRTIFRTSLLMVAVMIYYSCNTTDNEHDEQNDDHVSLIERTKQYNDSIVYRVTSSGVLDQLKTVLVKIHDTVSFLIPERTIQIKSYPCTNCHTKPIEQLSLGRKENEKKAHWDIKLVHGSDDVMDCFTCHNKTNFNELVSLTNKQIVFDESYKQCGQCHSTQLKDWVGGSHGKRLGGWAPPKIINTCANCHNPHQPAFETRWPSRLNTITKSKTK